MRSVRRNCLNSLRVELFLSLSLHTQDLLVEHSLQNQNIFTRTKKDMCDLFKTGTMILTRI